ncbi:MAG: DUF721 domain-containing protein [Nitrospirae bacterium]|nr:DUF721 domain-containing protein [Nitrospirota bacterium]
MNDSNARARARRGPEPISKLLPELARAAGWATLVELAQLRAAWPRVVGATVAAHSAPERLQNGRLTVTVDSSPWLTQLGFFKQKMQAQSNAVLGAERVTEVFLVVGRVGGGAPREKRPERPVSPAADAAVERMVAEVADPEVRDALRALVLRDLRQGRGPRGHEG